MKLKLLPIYFKKISLSIILFAIAFLLFWKISDLNISKEYINPLFKVLFILAGYFFIMSKEKIEDEFIQSVRLISYAIAFSFLIIQYLITESRILSFLGNADPSTFRYIINSIVFYIIFFYLLKYRIIKRKCEKQP